MAFCDVILPVAPFTETSGTFVNAEGRVQSFHAVVQPLGETRPAWKVLRVLGSMMGLPGFDFETSQDVLHGIPGLVSQETVHVSQELLNNRTASSVQMTGNAAEPVVASIYQLDGIVRRSPALQATADAKAVEHQGVTA